MPQHLVRDLMRIRHGHVVPESTTLRSVAERLIVSDCDVIAVTDAAGRLLGVVCESSVVRALMANCDDHTTIASIVSRHAESIRLDSSINAVLPLFRSSANTAIPVIDAAGLVCGLLLRRDVINSLLQKHQEPSKASCGTAGIREPDQENVSRPVIPRRISGIETPQQPGESGTVTQKPHFLRADAARQLLWSAEDRL